MGQMKNAPLTDIPEQQRAEHNADVVAKDTVVWGYDSTNLQYAKVAVDSSGNLVILAGVDSEGDTHRLKTSTNGELIIDPTSSVTIQDNYILQEMLTQLRILNKHMELLTEANMYDNELTNLN